MAATILGTQFLFGLDDADTPTGIAGFICRSLDLKHEPEVYATAADGNGAVEAVQVSKAANRRLDGTFTGYVTAVIDAAAAAATGVLVYNAHNFIVKTISLPRKKGEFVEVSIEASYFPLVTTA